MNQALRLLSRSACQNSQLLDFIEFNPFNPTKQVKEIKDEQNNRNQLPAAFFDGINFPIAKETEIEVKSHSIRLSEIDGKEMKPKQFYSFWVDFKNGKRIEIEKLYGDFKQLHQFIRTTFQTEAKEYERIDELTASKGKVNNDLVIASTGLLFDSTSNNQSGPSIVLNQWTSDEFYEYGKIYYDEAKRILESMPSLPNKYVISTDIQQISTRTTADTLLHQLADYLNQLVDLSPLIGQLGGVRNFFIAAEA